MKRLILVNVFFGILILNAQSLSRGYYIDIPTAHYNEGLYINLNGNYPIRSESEVKLDPNVGFEVGYSRFNAILKWYNGGDFALDFAYQILQGGDVLTSLSIGVSDVTYNKFISPVGSDETYDDEKYDPRPPEVASTYLVATKTFNEYFELTAGLGRGVFVGYGPRSRLLNYDIFFDEKHEAAVFGLFGGVKFSIPGGVAFIIETDGRDANLGVQYEYGLFKGTLALTKLEQFGAEEGSSLTPRIDANLSFRIASLERVPKKVEKGRLKILLLDGESSETIAGTLTMKDGEEKKLEIPVTGYLYVSLNPGIYMLSVTSPNYKEKSAKVTVTANKEMDLVVELNKKKEVVTKPKEEKPQIQKIEPAEIKKKIESHRINFSFDDFGIPATYYSELDKLIKLLKSYPNISIEIGGHASAEGTVLHNQWLSKARAKAVREYIIYQGIDPVRLSVMGYGESKPIAPNTTREGREKNRRVEFIITSYE